MSQSFLDSYVPSVDQGPRDPEFLISRVNRYYLHRLAGECAGIHPMKGAEPQSDAVKLRSNDYLCIARHPHFIEAEIAALRKYGHGDSISRSFIHHYRDSLAAFEARLAALSQAESAVLVNSGYGANVGLLQAICSEDTPVYIDMKAHISLWEGIKSAGARPIPLRHNDMDHLAKLVERHGPGVVVVDGVYSLDGDIAPLSDMLDVVEKYGCVSVVDETHSFGACGPNGAGLGVALGQAKRVHFRTIGLSKAVASRGGAIICSERNAEFLRYESVQAIFSTTVLAHEVAGYNAALDIFETEPERQTKLRDNHFFLKAGLANIGFNVASSKAQIIALEAGDIRETTRLRDELERNGIFGAIFMPPATPQKRCLMRFTLNCGLDEAQLTRVLDVCARAFVTLGAQNWQSTRRIQRRALLPESQRDAA